MEPNNSRGIRLVRLNVYSPRAKVSLTVEQKTTAFVSHISIIKLWNVFEVFLSVFLMVLEKIPSCDQERQGALDEARQNPREAIFIPDCGLLGLYKPVQCHQSTGYCWCVLVDTGRPIPGTSARLDWENVFLSSFW